MFELPINLIAEALDVLDVPYTKNACWDGWQLRFPWSEGDVVCHSTSYGSAYGKVETYQFPWDNGDVTCLTPQAAAAKIAGEYYQ